MSELKTDVVGLKIDVAELNVGQARLEESVHLTNLKIETVIEPQLQLLYENQVGINEHNKRLSSFENNLENLNSDNFILKIAVKELQLQQAK